MEINQTLYGSLIDAERPLFRLDIILQEALLVLVRIKVLSYWPYSFNHHQESDQKLNTFILCSFTFSLKMLLLVLVAINNNLSGPNII